jgi:hypothetical protein
MRQQFAQRTSSDGRFGAIFLLNDEGKAGLRLRLPRGDGVSDYKGLGLPQGVAVIEVLDLALRDVEAHRRSTSADRGAAKFLPKRRATSGRATAVVKIASDDRAVITLGIAKTGTKFDHVELHLAEARAIMEVIAQVLRDAELHRVGEGA